MRGDDEVRARGAPLHNRRTYTEEDFGREVAQRVAEERQRMESATWINDVKAHLDNNRDRLEELKQGIEDVYKKFEQVTSPETLRMRAQSIGIITDFTADQKATLFAVIKEFDRRTAVAQTRDDQLHWFQTRWGLVLMVGTLLSSWAAAAGFFLKLSGH